MAAVGIHLAAPCAVTIRPSPASSLGIDEPLAGTRARHNHSRAVAMVRELESAAEFLEGINDDLVALSLDLVQAMGATAERLTEIYATLPEGNFGEPLPGI
ncbi:MAG TPA: hypothetical protein VF834_16595 [Streptosporangiaceae bacterium]